MPYKYKRQNLDVILGKRSSQMTEEELRHIFVEVADGRGHHGSFLRSFAEAVLWADETNFQLLLPAMRVLVTKYNLVDYLDTRMEAGK